MAYHQVTATSLTPSRPAPPVPQRSESSSLYSNQNSLANVGYKTSFAFGGSNSTSSMSSYATSYSGIGASPIRSNTMASTPEIIRSGYASVKEDSITSLFWNRKFLTLKERALLFHKSEVSSACNSLDLIRSWFHRRPKHKAPSNWRMSPTLNVLI